MCCGFVENLLGQGAVATENLGDVTDIDSGCQCLQITHAALCQLAGHVLGDAKGVHEVMHRAAHLAFEDLGGVFILLDDEIHAHEA